MFPGCESSQIKDKKIPKFKSKVQNYLQKSLLKKSMVQQQQQDLAEMSFDEIDDFKQYSNLNEEEMGKVLENCGILELEFHEQCFDCSYSYGEQDLENDYKAQGLKLDLKTVILRLLEINQESIKHLQDVYKVNNFSIQIPNSAKYLLIKALNENNFDHFIKIWQEIPECLNINKEEAEALAKKFFDRVGNYQQKSKIQQFSQIKNKKEEFSIEVLDESDLRKLNEENEEKQEKLLNKKNYNNKISIQTLLTLHQDLEKIKNQTARDVIANNIKMKIQEYEYDISYEDFETLVNVHNIKNFKMMSEEYKIYHEAFLADNKKEEEIAQKMILSGAMEAGSKKIKNNDDNTSILLQQCSKIPNSYKYQIYVSEKFDASEDNIKNIFNIQDKSFLAKLEQKLFSFGVDNKCSCQEQCAIILLEYLTNALIAIQEKKQKEEKKEAKKVYEYKKNIVVRTLKEYNLKKLKYNFKEEDKKVFEEDKEVFTQETLKKIKESLTKILEYMRKKKNISIEKNNKLENNKLENDDEEFEIIDLATIDLLMKENDSQEFEKILPRKVTFGWFFIKIKKMFDDAINNKYDIAFKNLLEQNKKIPELINEITKAENNIIKP